MINLCIILRVGYSLVEVICHMRRQTWPSGKQLRSTVMRTAAQDGKTALLYSSPMLFNILYHNMVPYRLGI